MNQRLLALTVLASVAMMLAVSCGSADEPTPATGELQRGGVLRLGMTESSFDFDPPLVVQHNHQGTDFGYSAATSSQD